MGSGNRGGFVVDKGEATDSDFGLGLKMMMMGNHHHHHSPDTDESGTKFVGFSVDQGTTSPGGYSGSSTGVSGAGIGNFAAMFSSNNQYSTPITHSSTTMYGVGGDSASSVQRPTSLGFDPSFFKSWGGVLMGGGDMTRVFTASQRQELERQKLIYKHMAASMPVPPELLIQMTSKYPSHLPFPSYQSNDHGNSSGRSGFDLRYAIGSRDAEPWRCRRTDGKKWRCSRDVAPDQKYCERHSHKGRPSRSRKHVESSSLAASSSSSTSSSISNARNNNNAFLQSSTSSAANNVNMKPSFLYQPSQSMFMPQNPSQNSQSRLPEWFMKREGHHHEESSTGSPFFLPHSTDLDPFTTTSHSRATHSSFMSNNNNNNQTPQSPTALPRQFLDAWSIGPKPNSVVEITGKPITDSSLLTLSMAGGGSGVHNSEEEAAERYSWMGSSGPGGPLAEALCLGIVGPDAGGSRGSHHGHGHGETGQGLGFNK